MAEVYGYVRVSTREQKEDRQMIAMSEAGIKKGISMWINNLEKTSTVRCITNS